MINVWLISREELVQFWNAAQCSAKQFTELEGVDENGPIMQRFLNQQKGVLDQRKGDLSLLYVDDDEDEDEDESYEKIEGDENVKWDFHEEDWGYTELEFEHRGAWEDRLTTFWEYLEYIEIWTLGQQKGR